MTPEQLRLEWKTGDVALVGKRIMQYIPLANQVAKAAAILDVCRPKWISIPAVDTVATLAHTPGRWSEGHKAFNAVRDLTLREEKNRTNDVYYSLLFVAEITAKIIYNATEPIDPFDEDSAWYLPAQTRHMAAKVNEAAFEEHLWQILIEGWVP
jgi:hypothetical protein